MKKIMGLTLAVALAFTGTIGLSGTNVSAAETKSIIEEEKELQSITVVEEYDQKGKVVSTEITSTDGFTEADYEAINPLKISPIGNAGEISPFVNVDPGSMNYVLIDTKYGSSKVLTTLQTWVYHYSAAVVPLAFKKSVWSSAAGSATYNTFAKPPTTKYYTTKIYQTQDKWNYYGQVVAYEYSNSARTKLTKTMTHTSKLPK